MTQKLCGLSTPASSNSCPLADSCPLLRGPRGCTGPRGPQGPQPPLSNAVDSDARDVGASSLAVKTVYTSMRIPCYAPLTLHVRLDGDDAQDGLTPATAKKTLLGTMAELQRYDARDTDTTIQFGPGAFDIKAFQITARRLHGHPKLFIRGAGQDATTLYHTSDEYLLRFYFTDVSLSALTLRGEIYVSQHALLKMDNVFLESARPAYFLLNAQRTGLIWIDGPITVAKDCAGVISARRGATIQLDAKTSITFVDSPHYTNCVAHGYDGQVLWEGESVGSCTGVKYKETGKGTVSSGTRNPNTVIPGSVNGA